MNSLAESTCPTHPPSAKLLGQSCFGEMAEELVQASRTRATHRLLLRTIILLVVARQCRPRIVWLGDDSSSKVVQRPTACPGAFASAHSSVASAVGVRLRTDAVLQAAGWLPALELANSCCRRPPVKPRRHPPAVLATFQACARGGARRAWSGMPRKPPETARWSPVGSSPLQRDFYAMKDLGELVRLLEGRHVVREPAQRRGDTHAGLRVQDMTWREACIAMHRLHVLASSPAIDAATAAAADAGAAVPASRAGALAVPAIIRALSSHVAQDLFAASDLCENRSVPATGPDGWSVAPRTHAHGPPVGQGAQDSRLLSLAVSAAEAYAAPVPLFKVSEREGARARAREGRARERQGHRRRQRLRVGG